MSQEIELTHCRLAVHRSCGKNYFFFKPLFNLPILLRICHHTAVDDKLPQLIHSLQDSSAYDHPVEKIQALQTHISWVLLTGPFAYKIKKPLALGFLDFSTLDKRKFFCEEEIRLNRRFARPIYVGVVPITGSEECPMIGGEGEPIEYAVKMKQFSQKDRLDHVLDREGLSHQHIDDLASHLAAFHANIPVAGLETQLQNQEPLGKDEKQFVIEVDTERVIDFKSIARNLT